LKTFQSAFTELLSQTLPSGLISRALTSAAMSFAWLFNIQPACSAAKLAEQRQKSPRKIAQAGIVGTGIFFSL
jgi:hypothetical protein